MADTVATSSLAASGTETPAETKKSAVEVIKENSNALRGTIALELLEDTDHFCEQNKQLLKFHGTYQQEDRDARKQRKKEGVGKHYIFMVRCKIPAGKLTAAQYLAVDELADKYGNGTLRFTTRQGIQLHGVLKSGLKDTIAGINACLLTTLGACGDVERNVVCCPAPVQDGIRAQLQETALLLATQLAPRSRAYYDIWLNGQPIHREPGQSQDVEPLYGKAYLPRKFKTGIALPEDNCIDIHAQDLGLLAIVEEGRLVGFNVLCGGGMGMTHGNPNTFPYLAQPICYISAPAVLGIAEAVVKLFRDHGNRANRKRARLKYVLYDWGIEKFRAVLSEYVGAPLQEPRPVRVHGFDQHLGWHPQGDGRYFYGLSIENGRVKDDGPRRLRTALRTIISRLRPDLRITPNQDLILCNLEEGQKEEIDRLLEEHGVRRPEQISPVRRLSLACPAIPTCGLALTESERVLPGVLDQLEAELARLGIPQEALSVRMTGCPNGCARPYQADVGLVGRSGDKFTIFLGGHVLGDRLGFFFQDLVPLNQIVPLLSPLLARFREERQDGESFGDWCQRVGRERLQALVPEHLRKPAKEHNAARPAASDTTSATAAALAEETSQATAERASVQNPEVPISSTAPLPAQVNGHAAAPILLQDGVSAGHLTTPGAAATTVERQAAVTHPAQLQDALLLAGDPSPLREEVFFAGAPGEELRDYAFRYNSDGSIRETVVYFYGDDQRAAHSHGGHSLCREAVYQGRADVQRLYAARKLRDIYYFGEPGQERRDYCVEYDADGRITQTILFYYEGDRRAAEAPSGAALRRLAHYEGHWPHLRENSPRQS